MLPDSATTFSLSKKLEHRVIDILNLLDEFKPDFLLLDEEGFPHKKQITIGSYNLYDDEAGPFTEEIKNKIMNDTLDLEGLHTIYKKATKVPILGNQKNR